MQIRERGNVVRLVRSVYDEEGKSAKAVVLATVKRPNLELTDEERAKLTADELEQYNAFLGRATQQINIEQAYAAARFVENVELVSGWLSTASPEDALALSSKAKKALRTLRRQFEGLKNTGDEPDSKAAAKAERKKGSVND